MTFILIYQKLNVKKCKDPFIFFFWYFLELLYINFSEINFIQTQAILWMDLQEIITKKGSTLVIGLTLSVDRNTYEKNG